MAPRIKMIANLNLLWGEFLRAFITHNQCVSKTRIIWSKHHTFVAENSLQSKFKVYNHVTQWFSCMLCDLVVCVDVERDACMCRRIMTLTSRGSEA